MTKSINDDDQFGCLHNVLNIFSWLSEAISLASKYPEGTSRRNLASQ